MNELVSSLMAITNPLDEKMTSSHVTLFSDGIKSSEGKLDHDGDDDDQRYKTVYISSMWFSADLYLNYMYN